MNGVIRRRGINKKEELPYVGDWVYGKRFNANGTALKTDTGYVITPYYRVNPGDTITFDISDNYCCVCEFGDTGIAFSIANDVAKRTDFWAQIKRPRTITVSSNTHFIVCAIIVSRLSTSYILNNTTNQYLYKK